MASYNVLAIGMEALAPLVNGAIMVLLHAQRVIVEQVDYAPPQYVNVCHITKQEDDATVVLQQHTQTRVDNVNPAPQGA